MQAAIPLPANPVRRLNVLFIYSKKQHPVLTVVAVQNSIQYLPAAR